MWFLKDEFTFLLLQLSIASFLLEAVILDLSMLAASWRGKITRWAKRHLRRRAQGAGTPGIAIEGQDMGLVVTRSEISMKQLGASVGFAVVVLALVNQTVFQRSDYWLTEYSVAINIFDIAAVSYLCLLSPFGRNKIVGWFNRAKTEKH